MDIYPSTRRESTGFTSGVKTAVFVVVLGTLAAVADHAYFVAPHADTRPTVGGAPAAAVAEPTAPSFALPPELHPTQADVAAAPAPTF